MLVHISFRRSILRSPRQRLLFRPAAGALAIAALAGSMLSAVAPATPAVAADVRDFDPGYLISDYAFYSSDAMTQAEIQAFLESKGNPCTNSNCLDVYKQSTTTRAATERCKQYTGEVNESAARIIFKVQAACGISAKAILVTLQKEQGLITSSAPSDDRIKIAMGYGCPDTSACDSFYFGFFNQVYTAAAQFQRYRLFPSKFRHQVKTMDVATHPRSFWPDSRFVPAQCPFKSVTIKNAATAGLYNYTPYTPNASALSNLYGTGDSCASYGNRNFWRYYTDWFGNPTGLMPVGVERTRIAGADRYATSIAVSKASYPTGAASVFVAVGSMYADGLAAAPAAAKAGAPLLLTAADSLPTAVADEIRRLAPQSVVVVGGEGVVSANVYSQLQAIQPNIRRDAGVDRFDTARQVARANYPDGAQRVFLANGNNFPDALALSAAAAALGGPVLLVPDGASSVDAPTIDLLRQLGATTVVIAGGTGAISNPYVQSIRDQLAIGNTPRFGGADRYATAALINEYAFPAATRAFVASGLDFPDALSAAAAAGAARAPLVLSSDTCIPVVSVRYMVEARVGSVSFIGGTGVLDSSVYQFQQC